MLYSHLTLWTEGALIWHSLSRPGTRDLSMGVLSARDAERTVAWAKRQRMTIIDNR